jgi:pyridoxal phosphate enzyme (YggS family)
MSELALRDRLDRVREVVARRQQAGGWTHAVRIVAVTKTHGPDVVRAAVAAGLTDVGENRVQEALAKQQALGDVAVTWHLIGTLQRNKARHAAGAFGLIHSVDRLDLAQELDRRLPVGAVQQVLVQVNCSGEPQKGGVEPGALWSLLEGMAACERLAVRGLMTMAAQGAADAATRGSFAELRRLRDEGRDRGWPLAELSMGMSDDYPLAVEEGATMLRLGTALFGARTTP